MENDLLFRIILIAIVLVVLSMSGYYRRKADQSSDEKISFKEEGTAVLIVLRLSGLAFLLALLAYVFRPSLLTWSSLGIADWVRWVGVAMALALLVLSHWVLRSLGTNITPTVVTRRNHTLVQDGPYRWVRHPLYTTAALLWVALGVIAANWFFLAIAALGFPVLAVRTRKEEANLIERFGDEYREYVKRTGRYFPRFG